eukprot:jgi/Undpi1/7719/HiC_scaffold_23.g10192.m1
MHPGSQPELRLFLAFVLLLTFGQAYDPAALLVKLKAIPVENGTPAEVEEELRSVCGKEGIILVVAKSSRVDDGSSNRVDFKKFVCQRAGKGRHDQEQYLRSLDNAPGITRRNGCGTSRISCPFEVTLRHAKSHAHPSLRNLKLEHNHVIDREAMAVKMQLAGKLTGEMQRQVVKLTAEGMKPKAIAVVLEKLHSEHVNRRAVQNAVQAQTGGERAFDATDVYDEVKRETAGGGVCEVKLDEGGRLSHLFWQTREQVSLWNRFGHVAFYDDTAVKNRYRMPIGVFAVIDNEFRTRIVGQSITADTTTDTFIWMLENALASRGGKQPGIFIQDADAAMTGAVRHVFPDTTARRCLWHLYQNITKALSKELGSNMHAFMDEFKVARQQTSMAKFEEKFKTLTDKYPKADQYMGVIYEDRKRWAEYVSPLAFSVGSWTTSRVEERDGSLGIPDRPVAAAIQGARDGCGILYCQLGGEEIDGPERAEALKRTFEYIAEKLCDVVFVLQVCESRGSDTYTYLVSLFSDGSHLCQCRALQVLGLCCRHFWAAMIHSPRFRFHVGLLHEHWLTEKARGTPEGDWPSAATPKWVAADRHGGAAAGTDGFQGTAACSVGGGWKAFVGSSQTVQTVLLGLREKGPTEQDKQVLYADVYKTLALTCSILSDSFSPEAAKALVNNFYACVRTQAQAQTGVGGAGGLTALVGNPNTVRLPPRATWSNYHTVWKLCLETRSLNKLKFALVVTEGSPVVGNPCEAAAEGRQVGEDINTKCTGDIKVGDLLKKAGDHLLDIHPAFHSHGATRAFDIEIHKIIDKKQECKVLGTSAEEEESKQACMLLRKQC